MAKNYLIVYYDYLESFEELSDAECGRLLRSVLKYSITGETTELRGNERFLFKIMKAQVDRDNKKYERICKTNQENVLKRWRDKEKPSKTGDNNTSVYENIRPYTKGYENIRPYTNTNKNKNKNKNTNKNNIAQSDKITHELVEETTEKIFIEIPLAGGKVYQLSEKLVDEYQELYTGIDVKQEIREYKAWTLSNPSRRKTERGILRSINCWLGKSQNRGDESEDVRQRAWDRQYHAENGTCTRYSEGD